MPIAVILILTMLILPLPPLMLDFFFTLNILLALLIIMVALNTAETLNFSSFPTKAEMRPAKSLPLSANL